MRHANSAAIEASEHYNDSMQQRDIAMIILTHWNNQTPPFQSRHTSSKMASGN